MYIDFKTYKDKLKGCWCGKVAGGTLGAPFEGLRKVLDVKKYVQENPAGVPNDDVDFQLVALKACEVYKDKVDSNILAEYWLSLVSVSISEYGAAKNNLRNKILPPLSGKCNNPCKNSCGAFIRSELWACLCAGNPDIAVRYALEDACVDHSSEGVYGEIFCAAAESYAFIENDRIKIVDKALSFIPKGSATAKAVGIVKDGYLAKKDWKEVRYEVLREVPGSFGLSYGGHKDMSEEDKKLPLPEKYFDAPSNVALGILGFLYGEGDFGKTICTATNCGEDTDCTAGFAGALAGIISGHSNLPDEWIKPLGDKLVTYCLGFRDDAAYPQTVDELCERVLRLTPLFLGNIVDILAEDGYRIKVLTPGELLAVWAIRQKGNPNLNKLPIDLSPDFASSLERVGERIGVRFQEKLFDATVFYPDGIEISQGNAINLHIEFWNRLYEQQQLELKWYLPDGVTIENGNFRSLFLDQIHGGFNYAEKDFKIILEQAHSCQLQLVLEVASMGRCTRAFLPVNLNVV